MKVLMQCRSNFFSMPGGDTIQMLKTKEELEKYGVIVDISSELEPNLDSYDLVHLSNLTRIQETYLQCLNAYRQNKPIVLSTIFWPMDEFEKRGQIGIRKYINSLLGINQIERIKALARIFLDKSSRNKATFNLVHIGYKNMQRIVVDKVNLFLPNSELEMKKLMDYFNIDTDRYKIIPNGIDSKIASEKINSTINNKYKKFEDAIICVGRIETRKNQLALVKALDGSEYKLVLVGAVSKTHNKYFKKVKKYIDNNKNFHYIQKIENSELYDLYKVCKVSTLPSWLDTPGLVSLEAASMGCNLAISNRGSTKEYFKDYASYCDPDDVASIRKAIDDAYNKPKSDILSKYIFKNYTWEIAAKRTLEAYLNVLSKKENI
jgi:glycosyltransferase involved in cell wall biosynthesis